MNTESLRISRRLAPPPPSSYRANCRGGGAITITMTFLRSLFRPFPDLQGISSLILWAHVFWFCVAPPPSPVFVVSRSGYPSWRLCIKPSAAGHPCLPLSRLRPPPEFRLSSATPRGESVCRLLPRVQQSPAGCLRGVRWWSNLRDLRASLTIKVYFPFCSHSIYKRFVVREMRLLKPRDNCFYSVLEYLAWLLGQWF